MICSTQIQGKPSCVCKRGPLFLQHQLQRRSTAVSSLQHLVRNRQRANQEAHKVARSLFGIDYLTKPAGLESLVSKTYTAVKTLGTDRTLPPQQKHDQQEFLIRHLMPLLGFVSQYHPEQQWRVQAAAAQAALEQLAQLVLEE